MIALLLLLAAQSACTTAPDPPTALTASVTATSVALTWRTPTGGCALESFTIEAGSAPGSNNLASFSTGNPLPMFSAIGVAAGTYYVRVRSANAAGVSGVSNEVQVTVTSGPCTSAPTAPGSLAASVSGTTVVLSWTAAAGAPASYVIEAGSAAGSSDLVVSDTGSVATSLTATAAPGTYYVRLRAKNTCGQSGPSNEITVSVGVAGPRYSNAAVLNTMWSANRQTGRGPIRLTSPPTDLGILSSVLPIGLMVGDHVTPSDHMGFGPGTFNGATDQYPVYAMAAGYVVAVARNGTGRPSDPYLLITEHSGTVYTWTGLVDQLTPAIAAAVGNVPYGGWVNTRIRVEAGQLVGRFGGGHGLDVTVIDSDQTLSGFVVPQHYDLEPWKIHVVDLFDYVDEPLRSQLLRLNRRTAPPLGGRIDYDVDGTLAGNWFVEGTNWIGGPRGVLVPAATHVSISPHHINPVFTVFSLGDFGGQQRQYWATGNRPSPASVTVDSGLVKYELVYGSLLSNGDPFDASSFPPQGVLLVQMLSGRRLRLEAFPGRTLAQVTAFTSAAKIYER